MSDRAPTADARARKLALHREAQKRYAAKPGQPERQADRVRHWRARRREGEEVFSDDAATP